MATGEEELFENAWTRGRAEHPGVSLDREAFLAFCRERDVASAADQYGVDLYIACACAQGDSRAIIAIEREIDPRLVARLQLPNDLRDDVLQVVREKLLVGGPDTPPRISQYRGSGSLRSWIKVVAVRTAIDALRAQDASTTVLADDEFFELIATHDELRGDFLAEEYRARVEQSVREAFEQLDRRSRNILRQHYIHQLTIDDLGKLYGVHRVTAFRWVVQARRTIFEEARRRIADALGKPPGEALQIVDVLLSQMDVTLERLLRSTSI